MRDADAHTLYRNKLKIHAALQLDCKRERRTHAAANSASSSALRPASTCLVHLVSLSQVVELLFVSCQTTDIDWAIAVCTSSSFKYSW